MERIGAHDRLTFEMFEYLDEYLTNSIDTIDEQTYDIRKRVHLASFEGKDFELEAHTSRVALSPNSEPTHMSRFVIHKRSEGVERPILDIDVTELVNHKLVGRVKEHDRITEIMNHMPDKSCREYEVLSQIWTVIESAKAVGSCGDNIIGKVNTLHAQLISEGNGYVLNTAHAFDKDVHIKLEWSERVGNDDAEIYLGSVEQKITIEQISGKYDWPIAVIRRLPGDAYKYMLLKKDGARLMISSEISGLEGFDDRADKIKQLFPIQTGVPNELL